MKGRTSFGGANADATGRPCLWAIGNIGETTEILDGRRIPVNQRERESRINSRKGDELFPYYGATGQVGWIDDYLFDERLVLLGEDGAPFLDPMAKKAYEAHGKFWVNNHAHVLRFRSGNQRYLAHYLNSLDYRDLVTGTTRYKLTQAALRRIRVLVPPVHEQDRIVGLVDSLLSRIAAAEKELDRAEQLLTRLRQSLLTRAFDGSLTAAWRKANETESADDLLARISEGREAHYRTQLADWEARVATWEQNGKEGKRPTKPRKPKEGEPLTAEELAQLPRLPETWRWVRLETLALIAGGITKNTRQKKSGVTIEMPYLRVANVQEGTVDLSEVTAIAVSEGQIPRYLLQKFDLLFVEGNGSIEQIGRVATWNGQIDPCVHQNHLIRARFWDSSVAHYAEQWFHGPDGKSAIRSRASSTSGLHTLSISKIESLVVPLPPPTEQSQIVSILSRHTSVIRRRQDEITTSRTRLKALRRSILQAAFSGRLTAKWREEHPELISGDNSAEALLARIKEESIT